MSAMEPQQFIRPGLFLLALLLLAGCATAPIDSSSETPAPPAPVAIKTPSGSEPDPQHMRLTIAGAGDIMIGTDYPENHLPDDDGYSFLEHVTPVFAAADISFGNLEGVLMDGGEAVKKCSNPSACYLFRSPTRYARHLKNAGFDVMSLANNHAR
ncbi:MAG: CapA family protein, partial [Gammaproteobacteria bacterium]